MFTTAIIASILIVGYFALINLSVKKFVKSMFAPENLIQQVDSIDWADFNLAFELMQIWARDNGFSHQQFFHLSTAQGKPTFCASWKNAENNVSLLLYVKDSSNNFEFYSKYDERISCTTSSSKDAMLFPRPETSFNQAMTKMDIDGVYNVHLWTSRKLEQKYQMAAVSPNPDLTAEIRKAMIIQAKYITSLPLWSLRGFYWYFIRRNTRSDRMVIPRS